MILVRDADVEIGIAVGYWTGFEKIYLDNAPVSSKWSAGGGLHLFQRDTDAGLAKYEVDINLRWHWCGKSVTVRKNGEVIFSNR